MTKKLEFLFDFGSPNSYLAYKAIKGHERLSKADMEIVPCLLGGLFKATNNQPPMMAFGGVKGKLDYEMLEIRRYCERHKLSKFAFNPNFPINTLALQRGLIAADLLGCKEPYMEVVLAAMWEDGKNMNDPDVVVSVLEDGGLDAKALLEKSVDRDVKQKLIDNTNAAAERGVFGLPSFFIGDEMWFGKERIDQLDEALGG